MTAHDTITQATTAYLKAGGNITVCPAAGTGEVEWWQAPWMARNPKSSKRGHLRRAQMISLAKRAR